MQRQEKRQSRVSPGARAAWAALQGCITVHVEPGVLLGLPRSVGGHAGVAGGVSGLGLAKLQDTARGLQLFPNTERSRVTPLSPAQLLGERENGHGWAHPHEPPTAAHGTRKLLGQRFWWPLGRQHQELYSWEETWLARGRQAEETAGKMPKTAPATGNHSHCKHSPPNMQALGTALHGKAGPHQEKGITASCCRDYRTAQLIPPHRDEWLQPPHNQQITI